MKKWMRAALLLGAALILLMALFLRERERKEEILSYSSPDGEYTLSLYRERCELKRGQTPISALELQGIDVDEPGEKTSVYWLYDMVQILIGDKGYALHYNGEAGQCVMPGLERLRASFDEDGSGTFSASRDEFVERYNKFRLGYGCEPLPLCGEAGWSCDDAFPSLLDGKRLERHSYRSDPNNGLEPEMALYSKAQTGELELVAIGFENHGYTQWGTLLSKERSFFSLKAVLGDEDDRRIWEIYEALYPHVHSAENFAERGSVPAIPQLYVYGDVGLFSYFSSGISWLCISPVNELRLSQLELSGTEIIRL